jgi:linearmycin/streptolysin S transport system ATP-binding protein
MLTLSDIRKSFGTTVALDGLSLDIPPGEVFGLLGPNGAGKTTTINIAVGLTIQDSGTVTLGQHGQPTDPSARKRVGVAPQSLAIYDELTGFENLSFFAQIHGLDVAKRSQRTKWALDFVNLMDRSNDRVKTYSGGMKRRLNLAIALIHDPPLLLLDEPTVGVDPQSRNAIFDNIEALKRDGKTIVYTTHYMEEAQRLCDRVAIIDQGQVLALDTVDGLINKHGGTSVLHAMRNGETIRVDTDDPISELLRLNQQGRLSHVSIDQPDLEAVFLNLTGRRLRD